MGACRSVAAAGRVAEQGEGAHGGVAEARSVIRECVRADSSEATCTRDGEVSCIRSQEGAIRSECMEESISA